MQEQQIEELKNAVRLIMQLLVERGQPLTDDIKVILAEVLEHVATRITELRQQEGEIQPPAEIPSAPYDSAQINGFKYDPQSQKLFVKFQGKFPQQNGPVYSYDKVPQFIFDVFKRGAVGPKTTGKNAWHAWKQGVTPSLGAAMNALIKAGGYNYRRLS